MTNKSDNSSSSFIYEKTVKTLESNKKPSGSNLMTIITADKMHNNNIIITDFKNKIDGIKSEIHRLQNADKYEYVYKYSMGYTSCLDTVTEINNFFRVCDGLYKYTKTDKHSSLLLSKFLDETTLINELTKIIGNKYTVGLSMLNHILEIHIFWSPKKKSSCRIL